MGIDSKRLLGLRLEGRRQSYTTRDARLYALSVGFGTDPLSHAELDYTNPGKSLQVVPTLVSTFGNVIGELTQACELSRPELALHGQQLLQVLKPLPSSADLEITGTIEAVFDRGADRGAEIHMQAEARLAGEREALYRTTYVTIARGDGGFGGAPPERHGAASGEPPGSAATVFRFATRPNQALIYSLNGDVNPIHIDPRIARKAGFERPILHGLCTYGIACRAVLATACGYRSERIRRFDAGFSAPVIPGDTLAVEVWTEPGGARFQVRAEERDVVVLKHGFCELDSGSE